MRAAQVVELIGDEQPLKIVGTSSLADELRQLLTECGRLAPDDASPAAIVETTGEPAEIETSLAQVADLGTVVLAGPVPAEPISLDLYTDLHVRGLTLVGMPPGCR
jgi:hypothetical protein